MARTFTVPFHHNSNEYTAVVSQLQHSVCVYIPDASFHHVVPNGRFSYDAETGIGPKLQEFGPLQNALCEILSGIETKINMPRPD